MIVTILTREEVYVFWLFRLESVRSESKNVYTISSSLSDDVYTCAALCVTTLCVFAVRFPLLYTVMWCITFPLNCSLAVHSLTCSRRREGRRKGKGCNMWSSCASSLSFFPPALWFISIFSLSLRCNSCRSDGQEWHDFTLARQLVIWGWKVKGFLPSKNLHAGSMEKMPQSV